MAFRITLEYGHASMIRSQLTPEGYTHDWEVFVRGVNNTDIHEYIEKVVFHLHDSFRNPKRILKDPPFVVKESGYAGFLIPIEIYLKNKDEPKKFQISYDLDLQQSGPPINNVLRHMEIINNPSDEFRRKLLKGGAVIITRDGLPEKGDSKTPTMIGKPKLSGSENKKHRITDSKTSNSFQDLFGPPIKTAKISPDSKKTVQSDKNSVPKMLTVNEKSDKVDKPMKAKESPHKDSRKDKMDEKKDRRIRDSSKDKLKNKEKSKRPPSPGSRSHSSPVNKRPTSPIVIKKSSSPLPPSAKRPPSPKSKEKELKKSVPEREKDSKDRDKTKNNPRSIVDSSKSDKKKDKKKHKEDRDKEKRDKYKEGEKSNSKDIVKIVEKKPDKIEKTEKLEKDRSQDYKSSSRDAKRSPKPVKENDKIKDDKTAKTEKLDKNEKSDKIKDTKNDKDRPKHKHKKRDKKEKKDINKDKDKKEKREKNKDTGEKQNNVASTPPGNPLSTLLAEIPERDSSDSTPSIDDDIPENKSIPKKETEHAVMSSIPAEMAKPLSPGMSIETKKDKSDRNKREKSKENRGEERENRKRKRRSESKGDDDSLVKREKGCTHSTSPPLEPVSSSQSPAATDVSSVHHSEKDVKREVKKEKNDRDVVAVKDGKNADVEQVAPDSTNSTLVDADIDEPPVFSEEYVSQLKDLQQKIMTLQDDEELQRVVKVIAETGHYEVTKKTFDFDLCALDRRTVQRLQQFFSAS